MSDVGRVLRLDARRTALLVAVPVLVAAGLVTAWHAQRPGVAYWDATLVALIASIRLLGPLSAALAAWTAVRARRIDYLRGLTPRSTALGPLLDILLLTVVALTAYAVVTAVVVTQTLLSDEAGRARPLGIAAGGAALTLHVVIGYLAGRLAGHVVTAPVVAAATLLWGTVRGGTSAWCLLPPSAIGHIELFSGLRGEVLAEQTLWSLGLAGTLVLGYVLGTTRRGVLALPLAAMLLLTVAATCRLHATEGTAFVPAPAGRVCRQWPLTICVHPALRGALPVLEDTLMPLAVRLSGTPASFDRVEQRPDDIPAAGAAVLADPPAGTAGTAGTAGAARAARVVELRLTDLSAGFERRAAAELRSRLLDERACAAPGHAAGAGYSDLVTAWLFDEDPPGTADPVTAGRFGAWGEHRRRAWLRAHFTAYHRCSLTAADFR